MKTKQLLIIIFFAFFCGLNTHAQSPGDLDFSFNADDKGFMNKWGADNIVSASVLLQDGKSIVAGQFRNWNNISRSGIARLNSDGTLDETFNPGTGIGVTPAYIVHSVDVLPDGKIIIGGNFEEFDGKIVNNIARLHPDGSLDATFNTGTGFNGVVRSVKALSDGKVLVGGVYTAFNENALTTGLLRLNTDGTRDNSFLSLAVQGSSEIYAIGVRSDGGIIAGGKFSVYSTNSSVRNIVSLKSDGQIDTELTDALGTAANNEVNKILVQPDGKVMVSGLFTNWDSVAVNRIVRLNNDGARDTTFDVGTVATGTQRIRDIYLLSDGKYLIAGSFINFNAQAGYTRLVRLESDGQVDLTFKSVFDGEVYAVIVQPDGQYLVGGNFSRYNSLFGSQKFTRINPQDASLDRTFNPMTSLENAVNVVAVQPDGKIILGGAFSEYDGEAANRIIRLNEDGSRDKTFLATGTTSNGQYVHHITVLPDEKILVTGSFVEFNGDTVNGIIRLNVDGTRDQTFSVGRAATDANGNNNGITVIHSVQEDGKILLGGGFVLFNGETVNRLIRLNPDGSRDASFDTGTGLSAGAPTALVSDSVGNIYFAVPNGVWLNGENLQTTGRRIARLFPDGTLDTTFAIGNVLGSGGGAFSVLVPQRDGGLVVGGSFINSINGRTARGIMKFLTNGILDTTFVGVESAAGGLGVNSLRSVMAITTQADGKMVFGGSFTTYNGEIVNHVGRIFPDGRIDESFTTGTGLAGETPMTTGNTHAAALAIYPDDRLMVGGTFTSYKGTGRNFIARVHLNTCVPDSAIDVRNICGANSFVWIDGVEYTENNNTATYTLANSIGCDSLVTLNLTFLENATSVDVHEICGNTFTWIDGTEYTADNQSAIFIIPGGAANGCDSIVTLQLTFNELPEPVIASVANVLTTTESYTAYQWQKDGNIVGMDASYTVIETGDYTVKVTDENGCENQSEIHNVTITGIRDLKDGGWNIYPNPTEGKLFIRSNQYQTADVVVYNATGAKVFEKISMPVSNAVIDLTQHAKGVYIVRILHEGDIWTSKIINK